MKSAVLLLRFIDKGNWTGGINHAAINLDFVSLTHSCHADTWAIEKISGLLIPYRSRYRTFTMAWPAYGFVQTLSKTYWLPISVARLIRATYLKFVTLMFWQIVWPLLYHHSLTRCEISRFVRFSTYDRISPKKVTIIIAYISLSGFFLFVWPLLVLLFNNMLYVGHCKNCSRCIRAMAPIYTIGLCNNNVYMNWILIVTERDLRSVLGNLN